MIRKLFYLLPAAALLLFAVGCEISDDADGETTTSTGCSGDSECTGRGTCGCTEAVTAATCNGGTCAYTCDDTLCPSTTEYLDYRFVRIDDLSPMSETPDGGADIDSIILFKSDGSPYYATEVKGFNHGGGAGTELNPEDSLNAPDAFEDYPSVDNCRVDGGFVSLGGLGGYLIVQIDPATEIENGDILTVLEVGGCDFDGGTAIIEEVEVAVSVGSDPNDPHWFTLGTGEGPEIDFPVSNLPDIAVE